MIVTMKKISLLSLSADRAKTLKALRRLGVLHVVPVRKPEGEDLDTLQADLDRAQTALGLVRSAADASREHSAPPTHAPAANSGRDLVGKIHDLASEKSRLREHATALLAERARIEPFGDFDPEQVRNLAGKGVNVKLYRAARDVNPAAPESARILSLKRDASGHYFAVIAARAFELEEEAREVPLPERALSRVAEDLRKTVSRRQEIDQALAHLAGSVPRIEAWIRNIEDRKRYLAVFHGMGEAGQICYLQGFCPIDRVDALRAEAGRSGWGLSVSDPDPADNTPTLIRNPVWIRPIESLFKFIKILPGYREIDVSASFLVFLSVFFAMIVGDAGYGAVFLGITALARRRMRSAPPEPFRLLALFSVCTIVWGILSGAYFGIVQIPAPLRVLRVEWLQDRDHVMSLCLFLGAVHLSVAHLWNAVRMMNNTRALAELGWVGITWTMFFAARFMLLEEAIPPWIAVVGPVSLLAAAVFMTPFRRLRKEWTAHVMLPQSVISSFGDVLSYLRLFALGIVTIEVANAFNTMALSTGFSGPLRALGSSLILFTGHTLNVVLCALSVLVHGIRLNALEFGMHLGMKWTGFEFQPFCEEDNVTDAKT